VKARSIVVGYDGSVDARRALDLACDHVAEDGVVHVVTAYHEPSPGEHARIVADLPAEFRDTYFPSAAPQGYLADAERVLHQRRVAHAGHLVDGHPAAAILDVAAAHEADLIVLGCRGLGRIERFLHGSVSARVASHATTSLMIVRHEDHDRETAEAVAV